MSLKKKKCKRQSLQLQKKRIGEERTSPLFTSVRIMMERFCLSKKCGHSVPSMILTKVECPIQSQKIQII